MTRQTCHCGHTRAPAQNQYAGSMVYPDIHAALFNCRNCLTTYALVIWETPDEMALVDRELGPLAHERDAREVA